MKFLTKKQENTVKIKVERQRLTIGVCLMLRWGKGSLLLTCTGASGAPKIPSRSLRSDRCWQPELEAEGGRKSGPFIQCPHFSVLDSPHSDRLGSGPSISGDNVSTPGRRRRRISEAEGGGRLPRGRALTNSSLNAEKKPCFLSMIVAMNSSTPQRRYRNEDPPSLSQPLYSEVWRRLNDGICRDRKACGRCVRAMGVRLNEVTKRKQRTDDLMQNVLVYYRDK